MPTIFTRIIAGELPGTFVWRDERCVAFLSIDPFAPGHTLVVPIEEVDHWIDLPADLAAHLWSVAQTIGRAQDAAFHPMRVGVMVLGEEVPHAHIHLVPFHELRQMVLGNGEKGADPESLEVAAEAIRVELRAAGHGANVAG